ncbi:MAG TPA: ATP-binding protein, partial [Stellaceae bacterium]|nr:ATP-binding protein [Stellaceae bacterium]
RCGFDEEKTGRVALIATELATNLIRHASEGELVVSRFSDSDGQGVELLALDRGPGIPDVQRALSDGYSTSGTLGGGLGAMGRSADRFALFTRPHLGTAVLARFVGAPPLPGRRAAGLGAVIQPFPGEQVCGDAWAYADHPGGGTLLVVDGSGHGEQAAKAAAVASEAFLANAELDCVRLVEMLHHALAPTRGAALAVARIDTTQRVVRFVGIGNIAASIVMDGELRHMVSHNGTAGHVAPRIREFTYPYSRAPLVIMNSDGLSTRWDLAAYPGLAAAHPALIAGILYRDHRRPRDDCAVLAWRASDEIPPAARRA